VITLQQILVIGLAPILAAASFFLVWLILPADTSASRFRAGITLSALALIAATALAHIGLFGSPTFPPTPVTHAYFWAALLAFIPAASAAANLRWPRILPRIAAAAILAWMILRRNAANEDWSLLAFINWTALAAISITAVGELWHIVARSLNRDDSRLTAASPAIMFSVVIASAAPVVLMAGSLDVPSKLLGAIAAAIIALAAASFVLRDNAAGFAAAAVGGLVLPAILLHAALYSTLGFPYAVPLLLAPLGAFLACAPIIRSRGPVIRAIAMITGAGTIAAIPAIVAIINYAGEY